MDTRLILTVNSDTRSVNFCQTINIVQLNSKLLLNAIAHLAAPALGTEYTLFQGKLILQTSLLYLLCQKQGIGGGCRKHRSL